MSAGPSRRTATSSQNSQSSPKKRRHHTLEDMFQKQDRQEVERLSLQYRELLNEADGQSQLSVSSDVQNHIADGYRNQI